MFEGLLEYMLNDTERIVKYTDLFSTIGSIGGLVGGVFLGEQINDWIPYLQDAPTSVHLAVDALSMFGSAWTLAKISGTVGNLTARVVNIVEGYI